MIKYEFFQSPIYIEDKPEWVDNLNTLTDPFIEKARMNQKQAIEDRKKNGYKNDIGISYHSDPLEPHLDFKFLHDYIGQQSRNILYDMGADMDIYDLIFTESWVQEFSFNGAGHHWFHTHSNNHISGFYFLKCSDKTSRPFFQDPRTAHVPLKLKERDREKVTPMSDLVNLKVKPGSLVLFPAYMSHAYMVDHGLEPFRFIHINMRAVEKNILNSYNINSL